MSSHADVKHMAMDEFTRAESAAMVIRMQLRKSRISEYRKLRLCWVLAWVLLPRSLEDSVAIPYADIPNFPRSTAIGHAGRLVIGKLGALPSPPCRDAFINTKATAAAKLDFRCASSPALA